MTYEISGVHPIRAFLLDRVTTVLGWTKVNNLDPIAPVQQEPEFTNSNKPFIIYSYSTVPYGEMWELCVENISFVVYSDDEIDIRRAVNYMIALFKRADDSANDINKFVSASSNAAFKSFDFKTVSVTGSSSDGGVQEGGRQSGFVSVRAEYTNTADNTTSLYP